MAKISAYPDGGALRTNDQLVIARSGGNFSILGANVGGDGWQIIQFACSYSSADAPTFVISINGDVTALIGKGDRIKLTQSTGGTKYFIVTAVGAFSGGNTLVTVYGGTDYTLNNEAISAPFFSHVKHPFGFPADPAKWTQTTTFTAGFAQASPVQNTWYNVTSLVVPIGAWRISYGISVYSTSSPTAQAHSSFGTLSTANNSEVDKAMTAEMTASDLKYLYGYFSRECYLTLVAKATYYLNIRTVVAGVSSLGDDSTNSSTVIRALCAYL